MDGKFRKFESFRPGDRVVSERHGVGIVESVDGRWAEVLWLGSDGELNGNGNLVPMGVLHRAGGNVVSLPKSAAEREVDTVVNSVIDVSLEYDKFDEE